MSQSEYSVQSHVAGAERKNAHVQVTHGFGFAPHWLKKWRQFCWPITAKQCKTSVNAMYMYFGHAMENRSQQMRAFAFMFQERSHLSVMSVAGVLRAPQTSKSIFRCIVRINLTSVESVRRCSHDLAHSRNTSGPTQVRGGLSFKNLLSL